MSADRGPEPGHAEPADHTAEPREPWRIPFWALQILEYGAAFLLVTQSVHVAHGGILVAAGAVLAVLALTADGPLGVVHVCSQRLHRALVIVVAVGLIVAAGLRATRPDAEGLIVIACAVVALFVIAVRTTVATVSPARGRRFRRSTAPGPVIDATATVVPVTAGDSQHAGNPEPGTEAEETADPVLRRAGRSAGAATAAGRRIVDEHGPEVEDHVKRALRGAGRLAGRMTSPKVPPADPPGTGPS